MQRSLELHKIVARGAAHRGGRKDIPILTFLKHGTQKTLVKLKHLNFKHFLRFNTFKSFNTFSMYNTFGIYNTFNAFDTLTLLTHLITQTFLTVSKA